MQPVNILLVEDNKGDIRLTQEAVKESKLLINLSVVMDGVEAIEFLRKNGKYKDEIRPDIILLDLNLPKMDGRQVLAEIKNDPDLKLIPVVILTTSRSEEDLLKSYGLHANCYINKPLEFEKFIQVVQKIEDFWLTIVRLPKFVSRN